MPMMQELFGISIKPQLIESLLASTNFVEGVVGGNNMYCYMIAYVFYLSSMGCFHFQLFYYACINLATDEPNPPVTVLLYLVSSLLHFPWLYLTCMSPQGTIGSWKAIIQQPKFITFRDIEKYMCTASLLHHLPLQIETIGVVESDRYIIQTLQR